MDRGGLGAGLPLRPWLSAPSGRLAFPTLVGLPVGYGNAALHWPRVDAPDAGGRYELPSHERFGAVRARFLLLALVLPLLVPLVVFGAVGLASGMGPAGTLQAFLEQASGRRQNPLTTAVLGLFPVLLLLAGLWVGRRLGRDGPRLRAAGWGALGAILLVLLWANAQFWPLFLPDRVYPGFPHGLELVIGPVFFAPAAMLLGALVAASIAGNRAPRRSAG